MVRQLIFPPADRYGSLVDRCRQGGHPGIPPFQPQMEQRPMIGMESAMGVQRKRPMKLGQAGTNNGLALGTSVIGCICDSDKLGDFMFVSGS